MNATLKTVLIYTAKNAVNAALLALGPVYQDPMQYSLHTWMGIGHVAEIVAWAVVLREGMIWVPKILKWSTTNAGT